MIDHKRTLEPLRSPPNKSASPSLKPIPSSFFRANARNGSVPEIPGFKAPLPANVVNFVPKSCREGTLKIFKVREREDRELGTQGDEPLVKKGDPFADAIRKRDATLKIEFLVDKGKKEYERKKTQKAVGSMYVNDLWGKQYEVMVRRHARIDKELKIGEAQKRKPMHLKLKEAVGYFEHKNSASVEETSKLVNFNDRDNPKLLTEAEDYSMLERAAQTERQYFSEAKGEILEETAINKRLPIIRLKQRSNSNKIDSSMLTRSPGNVLSPSIYRSGSDHVRKITAFTLTEPSETKTDRGHYDIGSGNSTDRSDKELTPKAFNGRTSIRQKSLFAEAKGALDNLISMCDYGINERKDISDKLQDAKEVWLRDASEKRKKKNEDRREKVMEECADLLRKKREVQGAKRLSM